MAEIDLGKISFTFKGVYAAGTTYESKDVVQYTDSGLTSTFVYVNATAAAGQTPSTGGTVNTTYWQYMAKGGVKKGKTMTVAQIRAAAKKKGYKLVKS